MEILYKLRPWFLSFGRGVALVAILAMPVSTSAQDVTSSALKAAFIHNFAKFTEWPANAMPASGPFAMCVLGDRAVGEALGRAVKDRLLAGRSITVSLLTPASPQRMCHVLYVSGMPANQVTTLLAGLRDAPVLTISDIREFANFGGIVQLFVQGGQLHFDIQNDTARRVRLQISAKLLLLAERQ